MKNYPKNTGSEPSALPAVRQRRPAGPPCTPQYLRQVFAAADNGDIEPLCLLGREILERNWDVIGALEQRTDALCGLPWSILPGGPTEADRCAAEKFSDALSECGLLNGLDTFDDLIRSAAEAAVMPFAASEIIWRPGGGIAGFRSVEPWQFTLRNSFEPRLIQNDRPDGVPLPPHRFVIHRIRRNHDPAHGGKLRVLAWLHGFQNWPIKDLFSYIERFGMPFVIARVDRKTWEDERSVLHSLIRNFGPNGGGVFTKSTELELLNTSGNGDGGIYFRALEFTRKAIYTLLVGQLASSSDASGMSNGSAQTAVRQDILESDARAFEATCRAQIAAPWTRWNCPPGTAVPKLRFHTEPPADLARLAAVVETLARAGFRADPDELSERFGLHLTAADAAERNTPHES